MPEETRAEKLEAVFSEDDEDETPTEPEDEAQEAEDLDEPEPEASEDEPPESEQVEPSEEEEAEAAPEEDSEAEPEEAATEPEPEPEAAEAEAETEAEPTEETPPDRKTEPFAFKVDGTTYDVPGAAIVEHPDPSGQVTESIVIPKEAWNSHVRPRLADRNTWTRKEADYKRQIADLDPEKNETVIRAKQAIEGLQQVLDLPKDQFVAWVDNYQQNKDLLEQRIENQTLKARLEGREQKDQAQAQEEEDTRRAEVMVADLPQAIDTLAKNSGLEIPPDALESLKQNMLMDASRFYFDAPENNDRGWTPGELMRDDDAVLRQIALAAKLTGGRREQEERAEEAEEKNKAALGKDKKKKTPKTVPAKGAPSPGEEEVEINSMEDFKRWAGVNT